MAESISEGVLSTFNKQVGDYVKQDEEIASIETDKIDVAVNASHSGTITKLLVNEGDTVTVGQAVIEISLEERDTPSQSPLQAEQVSEPFQGSF
jgi:2-oxoglutarate dehydrogenase E2 component (dihydrolipoamide succinyltransferase)